MDRIVGRVTTTLKEKGLDENTIVIYSADNGYYMGDRGFQGKWSHYDQALHVPSTPVGEATSLLRVPLRMRLQPTLHSLVAFGSF